MKGEWDAVHSIRGKDGKEYCVLEYRFQTYTRFVVRDKGTRAAQLNWSIEDGCLFIRDLKVEPCVTIPPWFRLFGLIEIPPARFRIVNFQDRGIGTALVEFLVKIALSSPVTCIKGEIRPHDYAKNPNLPDWYRRRGFTVTMQQVGSGAAGSILMDLPPS